MDAVRGRLDVVAITDHDEIRGALRAREWALARPELGVDVVVGEEISTRNGHLLGLFLAELVPPGLTALETIEVIHAQGGLAVAAHPFHPLRGVSRGHASIGRMIRDDAIEAVNDAGVFSAPYNAWAALRNVDAFGENVIVEEVEQALVVACRRTGAEPAEFTVAPRYPSADEARGGHDWLVEFRTPPRDRAAFVRQLDEALAALNTDYRTKRDRKSVV